MDFPNEAAFADRLKLPRVKALYSVHAGFDLLYIGISFDLKTRFNGHHKLVEFASEGADKIAWIDWTDKENEELFDLEVQLIKTLHPRLNKNRHRQPIHIRHQKATKPLGEYKGQSTFAAICYELLWEFIESQPSKKEAIEKIYKQTELHHGWLKLFSNAYRSDASVVRLECLHEFLTGSPLPEYKQN